MNNKKLLSPYMARIAGCNCRSEYSGQLRSFASLISITHQKKRFHRRQLPAMPLLGTRVIKKMCTTQEKIQWNWKLTRFNSIFLDLTSILSPVTQKAEFLSALTEHLNGWTNERRRGIWARIPVDQSWVIADLYSIGFKLHHAKHDCIMMKKWLPADEEDKMPLYAFHTVGVSGLVLNEENGEALVVQDKGKTKMWKFPGGFSEPNEDIGETAVREVREETGVESEFKSLLAFRQQHRMAFDQSDLYFICHLRPLSFKITLCPNEIVKCEWLPLEYLKTSNEATPMTKLVASLAIRGLEKGFDEVSIEPMEMVSWVPPFDKKFKVFHRLLKS